MSNFNNVKCQQCQMSTMSNVNNVKYQQCQMSTMSNLPRSVEICPDQLRSYKNQSDNVKMSTKLSKCLSNYQNVNQIVKMSIEMSIKLSKCKSNCQNVNQIVKMSIKLSKCQSKC